MSVRSDPNVNHVSRVTIPQIVNFLSVRGHLLNWRGILQLVLAITGKDGQRLGEIERHCGAGIEIELDRMSDIETSFLVRGTADQIYKVQCLMQLW